MLKRANDSVMAIKATAFSILLTTCLATSVNAEPEGCEWQEVLTEYDTNKDGRLDSKEREILRKSRPMEFTCDPDRGSWDWDAHRRRSRARSGSGTKPPPHPLAQFDKNRNGIYEDLEVAAARAVVAKKATKQADAKP